MGFIERFRRRPETLQPYTYTNRETGEQLTSPFPAAVISADGRQFLGIGEVVGAAEQGDLGRIPAIEVYDSSTETTVRIMGHECWWSPEGLAELEEHIAAGRLVPESPAEYRRGIDEEIADADQQDRDFLRSSGIDPEG